MPSRSLSHFVRVYDGHLDASMCDGLIASFESVPHAHQRNGRGVKAGLEDSAWVELNVTRNADAPFLGFFRSTLDAALQRYNQDIGLPIAVPNSPKTSDLIMKRYRAGAAEQFQPHFDSIYEVSTRFLVFLWYLNDVAEGGATEFPDLGLSVEPRRGRLLMFPPYWMYPHAGRPPVSGDKYILSTYLLF